MDHQARRQAARDFRKKESVAGIFSITDTVDARSWVGHASNVETIESRLRFTLRNGGHMNRDLQAAWTAGGEATFAFEILEIVEPEALGFTGDKALRDLARKWKDRLDAEAV